MKKISNSNNGKRIAIIGIGFRIPSGNLTKSISESNELFHNLLNGFSGIVETTERWSDSYSITNDIACKYAGLLPLNELKLFDPLLFGLSPTEARTIDPQQRLLLKCAWEAFEDAGINPTTLRGSNASVYVGASTTDYGYTLRNPNDIQINIFGSSSHSLSNRLSFCFDLHGESLTIDTACSSSLNAVNLGCNSIKQNRSNISICAGVNIILDPNTSKSFTQLNILSPTGKCHSFSSEADGYVRSESIGVVILKRLDEAIKDGNNIYCVIDGSSSNVDGNYDKANFYSPSKSKQCDNINLAINSTNGAISASDIDYFECHGTGTPTGDPIELEGISMVFKDSIKTQPLLIGSIKSNIGHGEASSGIAALIKCSLMFKNKTFVPSINFKKPNPSIKFNEWNLKVVTEPTKFNEHKHTIMAINNFGVTGSNCCVLLSEFNDNDDYGIHLNKNKPSNEQQQYLIPMSSNSSLSLDKYKEQLFKLSESIEFNDFINQQIKFKINTLCQRSVIIANNWEQFKDQKNEIKSSNPKKISNITIVEKEPIKVFVLCGQGSQYNKMALSLYENEPLFRESFNKFDIELSKYYGYSIIEKLRSIPDNDLISIHEPILAQPINVMTQVSLFELYKHWGVKPDIIIGHSLGEVTSPYCSGMIDFETLCYLTYHRSVAQNKTTGTGRMLSINISPEEYSIDYSSKYPLLEIACYNSPSSIVVVGKEATLKELMVELKSKDKFCAMLGSLSSFHSSSQLMIKDEVLSLNIKSNEPITPVFSTVTTKLFDSSTPFNSKYVFDNILKPVYFTQTMSNLYKYIESNDLGNEIVFIEIAPHPTLQYYLNQMKSQQSQYFNNGDKISIYSPCNKKKNDYQEFLKTISKLYVNHGININFKSQINGNQPINLKCSLPLYQFDDQAFWKQDSAYEKVRKDGPSIDSLGNSNDLPIMSYQSFIDIKKQPYNWLKGHNVKGKVYFPGCGYIDNLLKIYPNQDLTINNIAFKTPFVLTEGSNHCLQTSIIPLAKNEYQVKSHFKDVKTNEWILASVGNFSLFEHYNGEMDKINIQELKDKCNFTKLSKYEIYETLRIKAGLPYKGLFQGVKQSFIGNNCSISIVSLNEIQELKEFNHLIQNKNMNSFFNAAILDTCLHGIIGFVQGQCQIVLDRIESFKFYSKNLPTNQKKSEIYVYSEMKPRINIKSYSGSIKIMLEDGTLLIEILNATCTSLTPIQDDLSICPPPSNEIYTPHLQSQDSIINKPQSFKYLYEIEEYKAEEYNKLIEYNQLMSLFYKHINQRDSSINLKTLSNMQYERFKQLYFKDQINQYYFIFIFENLKRYYQIIQNNETISNEILPNYELFNKTTKIMAKQLISLDNDDPNIDSPQSLFENNYLDNFYLTSKVVQPLNNLLGEIINQSIQPIISKPIVFRILEFGGGVGSLSTSILEKINILLSNNSNSQIDIEFTWSDISSSFFSQIKEKFSKISKNINIIYRVLDLEKPFKDQQLKSSYYDIVVMSNVLHVVKDIQTPLNQIYDILTPNGQLIFIEPPYKSPVFDSIFMVFSQWWAFEDKQLRTDRCCMKQETWLKILNQNNFKDTQMTGNDDLVFLIQTRKPSTNESILNENQLNQLTNYNNIILYGDNNNNNNNNNNIILKFKNHQLLKSKLSIINNINDFKNLINKTSIKNQNNLIIFIKSLNQLNIDNFKEITYEYIQINQSLLNLENSNNFKQLLLTYNSISDNYLSSSIIGAARYMVEFPQIDFNIIDFDDESIKNDNLLSLINYLLNLNNGQKEFFVQNNQIYFERFKKQTNIKSNFKSSTFEENKDQMLIRLDSNLEYKLKIKKQLKPTEIEVQVKGTGINYKDYLIYIGYISQKLDINYGKEIDSNEDNESPNIGNDFSGIITRVGCNVKNLKVGDSVCGVALRTNSSHVLIDQDFVCYKPQNISFSEAASIPSVYVTVLHSVYYIGNLKSHETILIHSGAGGVGLSALEILKYKKHQGHIFVTVGSKEKEQYLINRYGSFISGIYSTRNKNYVNNIKKHLISLGCDSDHQGVDLVLNTLSSEYMDSNFQCLNTCGRISDLSITHLTPNDYMDYSKFKFNYGYQNIELVAIPPVLCRKHLKKILKKIESGELQLIPIIEFSNSKFKDAIEHVNDRKHIGKIVVNHDQDLLSKTYDDHYFGSSNEIIMKDSYHISNLNLGKNILLTGQTGIILEILKWLVKYSNGSIENIIILSKSPIKWELELLINQTKYQKNNNIQFYYKQIDIENSNEIENVIDDLEIKSNITNIDTIIHFAFVNDIRKFEEVDINSLTQTHGAKTHGAINLHNQSLKRKWSIKQFIMASSVVSIFGSTMQCSYVSACSVIDSLSKYRKSIGLPSLSINLGAISSTGFVSRNESINEMFNSSVLKLFSSKLIISSLDLFIQNNSNYSNYCLSDFDFENLPINHSNQLFSKFDYQINQYRKSNRSNDLNNGSNDNLKSTIINKISELLSIEENKLNLDFRLIDYGLDSLVIVQLKNWIDKEFGHNLITIQQLQNNKISVSVENIIKEYNNQNISNNNNNNNNNNKTIESKSKNQNINIEEFIQKEIIIDEPIISKPYSLETILNNQHKSIFLTGATGFLGAYLLYDLVRLDHCSKVYCLLRNKSNTIEILDQLLNNLKKHQLYNKLNQQQISKIIPIQGELSKKRLGISDLDYSGIINECDIIINSAADLDLQSNYESNKIINVNPIKELIKMSSEGKTQKLLIQFSSFSVFLKQPLNDIEFDELKVYPNFENTNIGYIQSKVVGERLLMEMAKSKGIPSIIMRLPEIWSNPETGIGHGNDAFTINIQCSKLLGYYPIIYKDFFGSPVTILSKNILNILFNIQSWKNNENNEPISIFNLNGETTNMKFLFDCLNKNYQCKEIEYDKWIKLVESSQYEPCKKYNSFHNVKDQDFINKVSIDKGFKMSNRTKQLLKSIDSLNEDEWDIDEQMVINMINHYIIENK